MPKTQDTSFGREPHTLGTAGLTAGAEHVKSVANHRAKFGSVSSIPTVHTPRGRGGDSDPYLSIQDPELRLAVMSAHRQWAIRFAPWLLKEWDKS